MAVCLGNEEAGGNGMQLTNTDLAERRSVASLNGVAYIDMMQAAVLQLCGAGL